MFFFTKKQFGTFSVDLTAPEDLLDLLVSLVIQVATVRLPAEFRRSSLLPCLTSTSLAVSIPTIANPRGPTPEVPDNPLVPVEEADTKDS